MIIVDTSVWIDHLHKAVPLLGDTLENGDVATHPFVIGEIACGEIARRQEVLTLLSTLPSAVVATDEEALHFIEHYRLMGKGIGYIDAHLLASAMLTNGATLWTRDKRLNAIATKLQIEFASA
ncbi:MAG TPA: type II toxin-antitoxin system VapC family toxin [Thermoanaerobaculia bacterium]|nr:type II toxin-antitoxin system VapC family toxin [Thermoanaerobaculia bacterium]